MSGALAPAPELGGAPSTRPYSQWFEPHPALGISMMDHLFNRLDGAYPHWWRSNFANQQAIDNWQESWVEAFEEEGVTPADVKTGLRACRSRYDKPPSCAEFIKACKPQLDPSLAYYEAVAGLQERAAGRIGLWSHPAVYWAAMTLKSELGALAYQQIKTRWEKAFAGQMERTEWMAVPEPLAALPAPGQGHLSREDAARMLREINALGVNKATDSKFDHLRWAHRIMDRVRAGDKRLEIAQINNAKEALGIT